MRAGEGGQFAWVGLILWICGIVWRGLLFAAELAVKLAKRFGVGVATAVRWSQRLRTEGSPAARPMGGHRPMVLAGERDWLLRRIAEQPDLTLRAIRAELAERGVRVSYDAVWRFDLRQGVTFKKKPARRRAGPAGRGEEAGPLEAPSGKA